MKRLLVMLLLAASCLADEALVEVKSGDIIAVKPNGSVWGRMETDGKHYTVKKIEDKDLKYDGATFVVYPYAVHSNQTTVTKGETNVMQHLVAVSRYKVDPKADDKTPLKKDSPSFTNVMKAVTSAEPKEEPVEVVK